MKYFVFIFVAVLFLGGFSDIQLVRSSEPSSVGSSEPSSVGSSEPSSVGGDSLIQIENPIKADNIQELFQILLDIVLVFAVPIVVFFIIYAGFLYVTAQGSEDQIKKAHAALLYALIGGLLILGASVLIDIVQGTVDSIKN
jgi:hypothetical protein